MLTSLLYGISILFPAFLIFESVTVLPVHWHSLAYQFKIGISCWIQRAFQRFASFFSMFFFPFQCLYSCWNTVAYLFWQLCENFCCFLKSLYFLSLAFFLFLAIYTIFSDIQFTFSCSLIFGHLFFRFIINNLFKFIP